MLDMIHQGYSPEGAVAGNLGPFMLKLGLIGASNVSAIQLGPDMESYLEASML